MAPKLSDAQDEVIRRMINSGLLSDEEIAKEVPCSHRSIRHARANLRRCGKYCTTAPCHPGGRPRLLNPSMVDFLLERLKEENDLNLNEQAYLL